MLKGVFKFNKSLKKASDSKKNLLEFLQDIKISSKITLLLIFIILVFFAAFLANYLVVKGITKDKNLFVENYESLKIVQDMQNIVHDEYQIQKDYLTLQNSNYNINLFSGLVKEFDTLKGKVNNNSPAISQKYASKIDELITLQNQVKNIYYNSTIRQNSTNSSNKSLEILSQLEVVNNQFQSTANDLALLMSKEISSSSKQVDNRVKEVIIVFALITIIAIALTSMFAVYLSESVVKNINLVSAEINNIMTHKDFTKTLPIKGNDEISNLCKQFNKMLDWRKGLVISACEAVDMVDSVSANIKNTTARLSFTAQNESQIVEEFTASVTQMHESIQEIAKNIEFLSLNAKDAFISITQMSEALQDTAENIEDIAKSATEASSSVNDMNKSINIINLNSKNMEHEAENCVVMAQEGNKTVNNAVTVMDEIYNSVFNLCDAIKDLGNSAEKVGEIVNVIDDIAEQTNLLSLNAAIEAARAGESGKGFAVVANSIRSLAEKSTESTKDISKLIKEIQTKVKNAVLMTEKNSEKVSQGVSYVKTTGITFNEIFEAINKTTKSIQEISKAIEQQEMGFAEITRASEKTKNFITYLSSISEQQAANSDGIVDAVNKINHLIADISASTQEQAVSSEEIAKLIQEINKDAQFVSGASKEIADSVVCMNNKTQELNNFTKQFKYIK